MGDLKRVPRPLLCLDSPLQLCSCNHLENEAAGGTFNLSFLTLACVSPSTILPFQQKRNVKKKIIRSDEEVGWGKEEETEGIPKGQFRWQQ